MHTHSIEDFRMHTSSSGKRIHETSASLSDLPGLSHITIEVVRCPGIHG